MTRSLNALQQSNKGDEVKRAKTKPAKIKPTERRVNAMAEQSCKSGFPNVEDDDGRLTVLKKHLLQKYRLHGERWCDVCCQKRR